MPKNQEKRIFITEHTLELRHAPLGIFIDKKGFIADYIKEQGLFPHWRVQENSISFFDTDKGIKSKGAVISFKNVVFIIHNPATTNYFQDQAISFWKKVLKQKTYSVPKIQRLGVRTKCYIPSELSFHEIHELMKKQLFNEKLASVVGGNPTDIQVVLDFKEKNFSTRVVLGPLKENEGSQYFSCKSEDFTKAGIFIDTDYYQEGEIVHENVEDLLKKAMNLTWIRLEVILKAIGA
ncbi:MAG: hypothetical protein Q7V63_01620 [Gammaproteobacteria bacterium]|nr:hypothetical protein [Gammaproteobacteria bacterium]